MNSLNTDTRRVRGRPKLRWFDDVREELNIGDPLRWTEML
jgi:hypothetical protein